MLPLPPPPQLFSPFGVKPKEAISSHPNLSEMCQADAAIPTQYTNAALQGHSLPPAGLALSCRPLLLGETHFLLAHRCLCSAGSALLQGLSTDHAPHSELPSFLVPLEAWPFLVHLHQGSIQKGPDVWGFFLVKRKSSPGVAGLFS